MTRWKAPAPEELVYVIGDVHGCVAQLETLLTRIDNDRAHQTGAAKYVFVGDYIDRGDGNADVLTFMAEVTAAYPDHIIGLMGNHERMALDFLADPTGPAKRWLRYGGLQTMASYGVGKGLTTDTRSSGALLDAAGDLMEAMGSDIVDWLSALPLSWSSGNLWVVHAGADPLVPMEAQQSKTLLWGHDAFLNAERTDGQWVAFGHQPFDAPYAQDGRIACDTGAVYGGQLSAARIDPEGDISFLSA